MEYVISDELLKSARTEFAAGNFYIAYNARHYFLDAGDLYFFKTVDEANDFAVDNYSDHDSYTVITARSIDELLNQLPYGESLRIHFLTHKNYVIMNEKNFEYLKDQVKYHGFGEALYVSLEEQLKKAPAEFALAFKTEMNKVPVEATLHFRKSDTTDLYFFNNYAMRVTNEKDETLTQNFKLNNNSGVTLKEAYNLLHGRAVHKEFTKEDDTKYKAWIQLDLSGKDEKGNYERKMYHENYGYDLKEALSYYPIKELLKEDAAKELLKSLEKGNVQLVTVRAGNQDVRVFIEANPQYKSLIVYNNKMERLDKNAREELMKKPAMKEDLPKEKNNHWPGRTRTEKS